MPPNHVNTRVSPCRATVMVPSGQRPPLSTWPLVMISIKKTYDFDDPNSCKLSDAIEVGMLRLGPFGANGELEFVGRLIVHRCELAAPIARNVWSRRRGLFLRGAGAGRSVCRRRKSWRRRGKLRGCGRNRCCHGDNEHNGAAEECPGHDLLLSITATRTKDAARLVTAKADAPDGRP